MKQKKQSAWLFLLLLGTAGFFGYLAHDMPSMIDNKRTQISANSPEAAALVNKHLFLDAQKREMTQQKRRAENSYLSPQIGDSIWPKPADKSKQHGVDHSPDTHETNAYHDLKRYEKELNLTRPDHIIQGEIADQQRAREYEEAYKEEYARQFVENARQNGYEITLDQDYTVIRVDKIPNYQRRDPSALDGLSKPQAQ